MSLAQWKSLSADHVGVGICGRSHLDRSTGYRIDDNDGYPYAYPDNS
jgi:hypothetical protein